MKGAWFFVFSILKGLISNLLPNTEAKYLTVMGKRGLYPS